MNLRPGVSPLQFFIIVINTSFGSGMLSMPRSVAAVAKEDMWLSVIFSGIAFLFLFWAVVMLSQYFPECTWVEYHRILLGPILGQFLNILLLSLLVVLTALSMRGFTMAIKIILLDITPLRFSVAILLLLVVYAVQYGLAPLIRMQQLVFMSNYFLFIPLILLGLLAVDTNYYQPMLAKGFTPVIKGMVPSWFAYSGPEFLVGLLYPFITKQKEAMKWGTAGIAVLIFMYTLITIIIQGILTYKEAAYMLVPTISAYRAVEIPDTFIERLDGYLLILWIPLFFMALTNLFYFSSFGVARLLKFEDSRPVTILFVPLIYYLAIVVPNTPILDAVNTFFIRVDMMWGLGIVPLLLVIAWLKEKRRGVC